MGNHCVYTVCRECGEEYCVRCHFGTCPKCGTPWDAKPVSPDRYIRMMKGGPDKMTTEEIYRAACLLGKTDKMKLVNMILTGALLGVMGIIPLEDVEDALLSKIAAKDPALADMNRKALEAGFAWGEDPDHIIELEKKEVSDSKYSLEKTTVGELLDTPELRAIVERIAPQILEHPLIEAGRMFKIADALPYMKDRITKEQLEKFKSVLEKFGSE